VFEGYETESGLPILTTRVLFPGRWPGRPVSISTREKVGESMNFTVVRAVRGSDLSPPRPGEGLRRVTLLPPSPGSPAAMDLPYADEVLHLEIGDFQETVPGSLD